MGIAASMSTIADESPPDYDVLRYVPPPVAVGLTNLAPSLAPGAAPSIPGPAAVELVPDSNAAASPNSGTDGSVRAPRADHTSLPPELWLEIFRYATHVPRARTIAPADPFTPERPANYAWGMNSPIQSMHTKCVLVRVCRVWRALATELLYGHVVLGSARRVQLFYRTLFESREAERKAIAVGGGEVMGHGRWVRHLEVRRWARTTRSTQYWECVVRSVYMCPRLRVFSGIWQDLLPQNLPAALEQYLPSTLQELYWQQDGVVVAEKELPILTTSFLSKFSTLRVLDLRKICILDAERSIKDVQFVALTLPHVVYLALPTCPLLLRFASMQDMPALRYLVLDADGAPRTVWAPWVVKELANFLDKHGPKLTTVELLPAVTQSFRPGPIGISAFLSPTTCPNLDTLVFDCREKALCPSGAALAQVADRDAREHAARAAASAAAGTTGAAAPLLEAPHPRLRRVGIRGTGISRLYPNKPSQAQAHLAVLAGCRAFFPALEVVRTLGFLVGTSTDPFAPDVFIWWTERFERAGVDLQDGEGVVWLLEEEEKKGTEKEKERERGPTPGDGAGSMVETQTAEKERWAQRQRT
ncbi:uncharacterized protein TRAVEDRAFT_141295 [Trametes versicolor FP-101664 SS1]|uniref:uncharacterized protein n=1 Tax=Trametes versicolor (strain FP-101664) TaxID=717944 RepID=UPI0004621E2D|nr:uncharacterized protein TRAVEDRAFT_141295 [Trametes versicolor FP-101664 SS1]EIW62798.1 hypothetical protein TRAVEDRAFT_141295 [Trametes versicolor FP-101664 SS1]